MSQTCLVSELDSRNHTTQLLALETLRIWSGWASLKPRSQPGRFSRATITFTPLCPTATIFPIADTMLNTLDRMEIVIE